MSEVTAIRLRKTVGVGFIHRINRAARWHRDPLVADDEGADGGIEREARHAIAGRVDKHRGRAVHDIAGGDLPAAWLEDIDQGIPVRSRVRLPAENREDGANADIDVDVT